MVARKKRGRIIKPVLDGQGHYLQAPLSKNGECRRYLVHRLVAQAFLSNPHNYPEVNHKDENKTNNAVQNLEWCDHTYNNNYGSKLESTRGVKNPMNKITPEIVKAIRASYSPRDKENSATALAERYGISATHVCAIAKGRRWGWL